MDRAVGDTNGMDSDAAMRRLSRAFAALHASVLTPSQSSLECLSSHARLLIDPLVDGCGPTASFSRRSASSLVVGRLANDRTWLAIDAVAGECPEQWGRNLHSEAQQIERAPVVRRQAFVLGSVGRPETVRPPWGLRAFRPLTADQSFAIYLGVAESTSDASVPLSPPSVQVTLDCYTSFVGDYLGRLFPTGVVASTLLSTREEAVAAMLVRGHDVHAIARTLAITSHTVHCHLKRMHKKYNVRSRGALIARLLGVPNESYLGYASTEKPCPTFPIAGQGGRS